MYFRAPSKTAGARAAIQTSGETQTAHYLLGTWYFARGKTDRRLVNGNGRGDLNPDTVARGQSRIGVASQAGENSRGP